MWSESRSEIALHLPGIGTNRLPAKWMIQGREIEASSTPDSFSLNESAFQETLVVTLKSGQETDSRCIRGVAPWGLVEEASGRFVNPNRERLPMRSYFLVAPEPFQSVERTGFETDDNPVNEAVSLRDNSRCFITRLWPNRNAGSAKLRTKSSVSQLRFSAGRRIEARMIAGVGASSAFRHLRDDRLELERLPELFLLVPEGHFGDNRTQLQSRFSVVVDDGEALKAFGGWQLQRTDEGREIYRWAWSGRGVAEPKPLRTFRSFRDLDPRAHEPAELTGPRTLAIVAGSMGLRFEYKITFLKPTEDVSRAWSSLPGRYLVWFLLCQDPEGCTWDRLRLNLNAISPDARVDHKQLKLLVEAGMVVRRGNAWQIAESRAVLESAGLRWNVYFCGDPTILWRLYRHMRNETLQSSPRDSKTPASVTSETALSPVSVVVRDGGVISVAFSCSVAAIRSVRRFLDRCSVQFVADLAKGKG